MLHILGMIGKGIGITLLCLLILLVVLLAAVLFVPIRYRIFGKKEEEGAPEGRVRISWLLYAVNGFATWEGKLHYGLKLFGIPVYDNLRKTRKKKKKIKKQKREKIKKNKKDKARDACGEEVKEEDRAQAGGGGFLQQRPETSLEENPAAVQIPETETHDQGKSPPGKKSLRERIAGKLRMLRRKIEEFVQMLIGLLRKMTEFPDRIREKAQRWHETAAFYISFLERDEWKRAFALCRRQIWKILRSIRPRTVRADIRFGLADPSATGQILAVTGMLYPVLGKNMILRPDFEEKVLCGKLLVKGKVTVFVLLKTLLILYFDRDIKRLIRMWKKEETLHGRQ